MTATRERSSRNGATVVPPQPRVSLSLLGGFELTWDGDPVPLPVPAQRLLAFLAVRDRPVERAYAAETLWLESTADRACGSLRSALWRLRRPGHELVDLTAGRLQLASEVVVDVRVVVAWARSVLDAPDGMASALPRVVGLGAAVSGDLLPEWYDDWLVVERERLRELRVRALEHLCVWLTGIGSFSQAMEAGLAAVNTEPLRESARRCLIGVYLAEGNQADALRAYRLYRDLLLDQLGLEPSACMEELVDSLKGR